jgi:hypothetical protein
MPPPPIFPALPWFIALIALITMPFCFGITMWKRHKQGTCDRPIALYLIGQVFISASFVVLIGIPNWKRVNLVGHLKDATAEYPEVRLYTLSTAIWWVEFGWTIFGVRNAAEADACSTNLKYSANTLAGYMMGLGLWLDFGFHILIPALLHMYSGQPAADLLPPGSEFIEPGDSLPPAPPKRKAPPPQRECPKCLHTEIPEELKMCPICGAFVPPLEAFIKKDKEEKEKEKEKAEANKKKKQLGKPPPEP